jgi:KUP system potassium uptake protein
MPLLFIVDMVFVLSSSLKLLHGGWFPLTIAIAVIIIITTWLKGRKIINKERSTKEGSLKSYVTELDKKSPPVSRVPGHAVYIGHHSDLTPLALHAAVEQLHELHEKATIVSVQVRNIAHVSRDERAVFDDLGNATDGLSHLTLHYGYHDSINIPKTLESLRKLSSEIDFDPYTASYFVSLAKVVPTRSHTMARWRKSLFCIMSNSATNPSDYFKLPVENTVEMRTLIKL